MIELLPGTWYVRDGSIRVRNEDGTETVYATDWVQTRRDRAEAERRAEAAAIKENVVVKSIREPPKKTGRGT